MSVICLQKSEEDGLGAGAVSILTNFLKKSRIISSSGYYICPTWVFYPSALRAVKEHTLKRRV
jgi:hypothetical protein